MIGVDMKSLLAKCNGFTTSALHAAAGQAVNRTHYEVTIEHFFLACLNESQSDIPLALEYAGSDQGKLALALHATLDTFRAGNSGRPVFSPLLIELLEAAWLIASVDLGSAAIRSLAVLLGFLHKPAIYAQGSYTEELSRINREDLLRSAGRLFQLSKESPAKADGSDFGGQSGTSAQFGSQSGPPVAGQAGESFTAKFCEDFTAKARNGNIDPVFGRDDEIRQMVDILARRRKNNPILVGEPGVGKTAVLEGLALRIIEGDVPDVLQGVTLLSLDLGLLEAGAGMKGEFERRLKGVLDEIKSSEKPIVLFIDEAHMLVGAGGAAGGSDAANLMKPALARGEIRTCAATTWKEYKKYFEKDPALARRFQLVKLDEPSVEVTALILRGIRDSYEKAHAVLIRDDALDAAARLAHRYITGRFLPDKAIDLLDTACARVKVSLTSKPAALEDVERSAQAAGRELQGLVRDRRNGTLIKEERTTALEDSIAALGAQAAQLEALWKNEREAAAAFIAARTAMLESAQEGEPTADAVQAFACARSTLDSLRGKGNLTHVEVSPDVVAQVVSDWTGVPVGRMAQEQARITRHLDTLLRERIKGQDAALAAVTRVIQASSAGLRSPNQPLGVFLLVGPSGVGKTETGLALAELLFGDERHVVTVNMSEFQEKHTVSRLIGSPPGYVGYGEGGMLTEAVRRRPYSVVLLDEVEKAHIDVLNLFYQVFDKGTLTDGEGKEVSFKDTIIMLTSNLASEIIQEMCAQACEAEGEAQDSTAASAPEASSAAASAAAQDQLDAMQAVIRPVLSEHFRPALLARMNIVPFRSLDPAALVRITELKMEALARRLKINNGMSLHYSPEVLASIVARCTETETGARNIDYILAGSVLPRLSQSILAHMTDDGMPVAVRLGVDEQGSFSMEFESA